MALTLAAYVAAWQAREVTHDGDQAYMRHLANARKQELNITDERGEKLYVMVKERRNSPLKIDLAMAGCLSWQARGMAVAKGAMQQHGSKPGRTTVYMGR
jgi:phage terminase large subunit-like protein